MKREQVIEKINKNFDIHFYEEFDYLVADGYEFMIKINDMNNTFSIYRAFSYPVGDNGEVNIGVTYEELVFIQNLYKKSNVKPEFDYKISMGCPYDEELVGYFNKEFIESDFYRMISWFMTVEDLGELDFEFLRKNFSEKLNDYYNEWKKENNKLSYLQEANWEVYKSNVVENIGEISKVLINKQKSILVGIDDYFFNEILCSCQIYNYTKISPYIGIDYTLALKDDKYVVWNSRLIHEVKKQIEMLKLHYYDDIDFYLADRNVLIIKCLYFWAIILPIEMEVEKAFISEKRKLFNLQEILSDIFPADCVIDKGKIEFEKLDAEDFEYLCKEVLSDLGFVNIFSRGNVNAADGGIDIECDEEIREIFGTRKRHWIFQCKHTKKQIDRKDVSEIPCLLKEFNAEGYGLFYTGTFKPNTLDRLKNISNDSTGQIQFWDNFEFARYIGKNKKLKSVYLELVNSKS